MNIKVKVMLLVAFLLIASSSNQAAAQQTAIKTNLLYDATTTPNIGLEIGLAKKHTMQLFYGLNPWKFSADDGDKFFKHWWLSSEYRYWFCHRFQGTFFGVHALGGEFSAANLKMPFGMYKDLRENHYEGWYAGGGLTLGYQWVMSRHWNFEASIGAGAAYVDYQRYECGTCGRPKGDGNTVYVGPTKAALSLLYMF